MEINDPIFADETKAREYLEAQRWPTGPECPHCGVIAEATAMQGKAHRAGLYQCRACGQQFSVTVGTVYERSKIPLNKWLLATHLICSSKTAISAHQLHRMLGITYKSAWFMAHRVREAMKDTDPGPMGGEGDQIQVDETMIGGTSKRAKSWRKGHGRKQEVVALVEPKSGKARAHHVKSANSINVRDILVTGVHRSSTLVSDESKLYTKVGAEFADHQTVRHAAGKYVNPMGFTTNNVENFFGVFKRGFKGTYSHCEAQHLQRYLAEFAFRYTNRSGVGVSDTERTAKALANIGGKRLTYRRTDEARY